ncbi:MULTISPECIES: hypothetical protein [Fervidicoccus]|uniref:Uncharacterized protein n=1 Tax=Fervidicoccus fontis TaxID=683846 RepID=A0A7C2ZS55_9CREN|nr:hypothetical protein [Fervidicoccus fontis]HEW64238.1 hypothetical protein [Fervidicoccus fontis]
MNSIKDKEALCFEFSSLDVNLFSGFNVSRNNIEQKVRLWLYSQCFPAFFRISFITLELSKKILPKGLE